MIVRISGEQQFRIPDSEEEPLNELDNLVVEAIEADDEDGFRSSFGKMHKMVRESGEPLPEDELVPSDLILPPADLSLEEAKGEFTGEGLIPD